MSWLRCPIVESCWDGRYHGSFCIPLMASCTSLKHRLPRLRDNPTRADSRSRNVWGFLASVRKLRLPSRPPSFLSSSPLLFFPSSPLLLLSSSLPLLCSHPPACPNVKALKNHGQSGFSFQLGRSGSGPQIQTKLCPVKSLLEWLERQSMVKSSGCSCRGPGFGSQQPHGDSQPFITTVRRDPTSSSDLHCAHR